MTKRHRKTAPRGFAIIALFATLVITSIAAACVSQEDIPPLERQAHELNQAIMCPVCPGESIDQSRNPLAVQMRGIVAEKLEQGWTGDQIKDFFVERYGPSVLLEPPREGFSLAAWVIPPAALVSAGIVLYLVLRLMRRPLTAQPQRLEDRVRLTDEERDEYFRRIESALDDGAGEATRTNEGRISALESSVIRDSDQRSD